MRNEKDYLKAPENIQRMLETHLDSCMKAGILSASEFLEIEGVREILTKRFYEVVQDLLADEYDEYGDIFHKEGQVDA